MTKSAKFVITFDDTAELPYEVRQYTVGSRTRLIARTRNYYTARKFCFVQGKRLGVDSIRVTSPVNDGTHTREFQMNSVLVNEGVK